MRILYMGTPDFAAASLAALADAGENVIGVLTQTDKPQGRGYILTPSPVKLLATERGIPVYQPKTLRTPEFTDLLHMLDPELIVVAAYGKILPPDTLAYPRCGCINVHGSLLPEYRGAAPIQRAMMDGRTVTGITTMLMDDGVDTGDILLQTEVPIQPEDDFSSLYGRMSRVGAGLLLETLAALRNGTLVPVRQSATGIAPTYSPKIEKSEGAIDFSRDALSLHNLIRALSPAPLAYTRLPSGSLVKIISSRLPLGAGDTRAECETPGRIVSLNGAVTVACGPDGSDRIDLCRLLPEGKGRMDAADFIRGRRVAPGDILKA